MKRKGDVNKLEYSFPTSLPATSEATCRYPACIRFIK